MKILIKALTSITLLMIAVFVFQILFIPILVVSIVLIATRKDRTIAVTNLSNWLQQIAFSIDQLGNVYGQNAWNWLLIRSDSKYKFGNPDETISSALGRNKRADTLSRTGKMVCLVLDAIDKNHCIKSIGH